ncbi:MAG: hypothetical protein KJ583_04425 [Nanoarchaeota archaeon]|nr:hypothetical protein [Nanoarchaeota archaeon]MBU1270295.1 hypothetical protein [Nanoarchaeota archaeon]MBU1604537.1 hypothetical protein [Nanoarchaeota archaeon]MBU2442872.1 hypothetical protein [Nanoarchaeota archaeon]
MVRKATNINYLINKLLDNKYSYEDIGNIFSQGLNIKHRDLLAFRNDIDPIKKRYIQRDIMRQVKSYLLMITFEGNKDQIQSYKPKDQLNNDSLLGTINLILEERGEESFDDIGKAVHQGSKNYLRKNPLAKDTNYKQFLEYKCIQSELQNLL